MITITPSSLMLIIFVASSLFIIGLIGIFINRHNIINILIAVEVIMLSSMLNFLAFSSFFKDVEGQIFILFILGVAAVEAALGLSILVIYNKYNKNIFINQMNKLKG